MNTYRNLFFIAVLGLAAPWLLSHRSSHKKSPEASAAVNNFVVDTGTTGSQVSSQLPGSNSGTQTSQALSRPILNLEDPPAETDPEKIALQINLLSETEVREWLSRLSSAELTGNTGHLLVRRWVELDPVAAVSWVGLLGDAGTRQQLVDAAAVAWSEKEMPAALTWVESLPDGPTKIQALGDLGYEVARTDPINALQIAMQLPGGNDTDALVLHSLAQFTAADPAESQQLALFLPAGPLRDDALITVTTVQAQFDGAGAARFVEDNIPAGPALNRAVVGVVQLWSQNSLPDASAWVLSFPESPLRDQALQSLSFPGPH